MAMCGLAYSYACAADVSKDLPISVGMRTLQDFEPVSAFCTFAAAKGLTWQMFGDRALQKLGGESRGSRLKPAAKGHDKGLGWVNILKWHPV